MRCGIILLVLLCLPRATWSFESGTETERQVVAGHNALRSAVRVPPVAWDGSLAAGAARWAAFLARSGRFEHSPASARPEQGENLWMGPAGAASAAAAVAWWGAERRDFMGGVFPDVSRTGRFEAVGHYTQIVWRDTRRVGCGTARSGGFDIVVCRYGAAGNLIGRPVY